MPEALSFVRHVESGAKDDLSCRVPVSKCSQSLQIVFRATKFLNKTNIDFLMWTTRGREDRPMEEMPIETSDFDLLAVILSSFGCETAERNDSGSIETLFLLPVR